MRVTRRTRVQKLPRLQTSNIQIQNTVPAPAPAPAPATCTCKLPSWTLKMLKNYLLELNQDTFGTRETLAGRVRRLQIQAPCPPCLLPPPAPCPLPPPAPCTCPYPLPNPLLSEQHPPAMPPASCPLPPSTPPAHTGHRTAGVDKN